MVTATGSGTPPYMAPEVWRGRVCGHSDQYSLASSYAEMRLNRRLYADRELMQVMLGHVKKEPDLSPLGVAEQRVIYKALSMEPEQRYPSCSAFVRALEEVVGAEAKRGESRPVAAGDAARRTEQAEASSAEVVTVAPSRTEQPAPGEPAWRMPRSQPRSGVPGTEPAWKVSSPGAGASSNFGMILGIIGLLGLAVIVGLVVFFLVQK
jgi:serine/threonine protein kinase